MLVLLCVFQKSTVCLYWKFTFCLNAGLIHCNALQFPQGDQLLFIIIQWHERKQIRCTHWQTYKVKKDQDNPLAIKCCQMLLFSTLWQFCNTVLDFIFIAFVLSIPTGPDRDKENMDTLEPVLWVGEPSGLWALPLRLCCCRPQQQQHQQPVPPGWGWTLHTLYHTRFKPRLS